SPQKVKKTFTSSPEAAAVVERMRTGHTRSRSPLQHTMDMRFCRSLSLMGPEFSSCASVYSLGRRSAVRATPGRLSVFLIRAAGVHADPNVCCSWHSYLFGFRPGAQEVDLPDADSDGPAKARTG